jgi:hypothetical protein
MSQRKYQTTVLVLLTLFLSKVAFGDSLVLVTQETCPPCKVAKELLKTFDLKGIELKEVDIKDAGKYFIKNTPTLVLLNDEGKFVASIPKVDKPSITYLMSVAEVTPIDPLFYKVDVLDSLSKVNVVEDTDRVETAAPRRIPYTISTQYRNGTFQGSFTWGQVDHALTLLERYWNVDFVRVNSGPRLRIIQANTNPNSTWAAWTRGTDIYISPVFNFGGNRTTCEMVTCHEFGHAAGGGSHTNVPGTLMHPNGGALIAQTDYRFFGAYQWKGTLRPHMEPNFAVEYWRGNVPINAAVMEAIFETKAEDLPLINCGHLHN